MSAFVIDIPPTPAGDYEAITVADTAIGFTASKILINQTGGTHKRAVAALVSAETQPMRFTVDGTTPTTTVGHLLAAGDYFVVRGEQNVSRFKAIRTTGSSGALQVTYFYSI